ncbi:MAG: hypothetical protein WCG99_05200, partial [Candidatus Berkelbacteria bacterium]
MKQLEDSFVSFKGEYNQIIADLSGVAKVETTPIQSETVEITAEAVTQSKAKKINEELQEIYRQYGSEGSNLEGEENEVVDSFLDTQKRGELQEIFSQLIKKDGVDSKDVVSQIAEAISLMRWHDGNFKRFDGNEDRMDKYMKFDWLEAEKLYREFSQAEVLKKPTEKALTVEESVDAATEKTTNKPESEPLDPKTITALQELGVDISTPEAKTMLEDSGFVSLSPGQQTIVLSGLRVAILKQVKAEALTTVRSKKESIKDRNEAGFWDIKNSITAVTLRNAWRNLTKHYDVAKTEKDILSKKTASIDDVKNNLAWLVDAAGRVPMQEVRDGVASTAFLQIPEGAAAEAVGLIEQFNQAATKLTTLHQTAFTQNSKLRAGKEAEETWQGAKSSQKNSSSRLANIATAGMGQDVEQRLQADNAELEYKKLFSQIASVLKDHFKGNEQAAMLSLNNAESAVRLTQFINSNPKAVDELNDIVKRSGLDRSWKKIAAERGAIAMGSAAVRYGSLFAVGVMGLPIAGLIAGTGIARARSKQEVEERDFLGQFSGGRDNVTGEKTNNPADRVKRFEFVPADIYAKRLDLLLSRINSSTYVDREGEEIRSMNHNYNDAGGVMSVTGNTGREKWSDHGQSAAKNAEELRGIDLRNLARLSQFVESKMRDGLVNYGKGDTAFKAQYDLIQKISQAKCIIALEGATESEVNSARSVNALAGRKVKMADSRKAEVLKQMTVGAGVGAGFALAGSLVREFVFPKIVGAQDLDISGKPKLHNMSSAAGEKNINSTGKIPDRIPVNTPDSSHEPVPTMTTAEIKGANALVGRGKGIIHAFKAQILKDPKAFGYDKDDTPSTAWLDKRAYQIAQKTGYVSEDGGQDIRVRGADSTAYVLRPNGKNIEVFEYVKKGDGYEFEESHSAGPGDPESFNANELNENEYVGQNNKTSETTEQHGVKSVHDQPVKTAVEPVQPAQPESTGSNLDTSQDLKVAEQVRATQVIYDKNIEVLKDLNINNSEANPDLTPEQVKDITGIDLHSHPLTSAEQAKIGFVAEHQGEIKSEHFNHFFKVSNGLVNLENKQLAQTVFQAYRLMPEDVKRFDIMARGYLEVMSAKSAETGKILQGLSKIFANQGLSRQIGTVEIVNKGGLTIISNIETPKGVATMYIDNNDGKVGVEIKTGWLKSNISYGLSKGLGNNHPTQELNKGAIMRLRDAVGFEQQIGGFEDAYEAMKPPIASKINLDAEKTVAAPEKTVAAPEKTV